MSVDVARCSFLELLFLDDEASLPCHKTLMLGIFLILLQAADGILTSVGVARYGVSIEGNPFLRTLMESYGHIPTLAVVKFLAVLIVLHLMQLAAELPWVKSAMGAVSCIYVCAAIIPWLYVLFLRPLF